MTTNIERAAATIREAFSAMSPSITLGGAEAVIAQALAEAGLLRLDLPEPHTFLGGDREWHVLDGFVNLDTDGTITVSYDESDEYDLAAGTEVEPGELVLTSISEARALAMALLAAADHAEQEQDNG